MEHTFLSVAIPIRVSCAVGGVKHPLASKSLFLSLARESDQSGGDFWSCEGSCNDLFLPLARVGS